MTLSAVHFGPGALRLFLALLVVISHITDFEIGRPAVFVFFALSGYWVSAIYQKSEGDSVARFYLSRFLRVWPPFAAATLLAFLLYALSPTPKPAVFLQGLALLGIASTHRDVLGVSWSLDIEIQFYALVPILFILLRNPLLLIVLTAFALPISWHFLIQDDIWTVFAYLPSFLCGMFIHHFRFQPTLTQVRLSVILFALVGVIVAVLPQLRPLFIKSVMGPFHPDWFGMAWTAVLIPFVAWNVRQKSPALDRHAGNLSYSLYITHWPVVVLTQQWASKGWIVVTIPFVALTFYILVDRTSERLRQRIIGGRYRAP